MGAGAGQATIGWTRYDSTNCTGALSGATSSGSFNLATTGNGSGVGGVDAGDSCASTAGPIAGFAFSILDGDLGRGRRAHGGERQSDLHCWPPSATRQIQVNYVASCGCTTAGLISIVAAAPRFEQFDESVTLDLAASDGGVSRYYIRGSLGRTRDDDVSSARRATGPSGHGHSCSGLKKPPSRPICLPRLRRANNCTERIRHDQRCMNAGDRLTISARCERGQLRARLVHHRPA